MPTATATPTPAIGDQVRIYATSVTNVRTDDGRIELRRDRCLQPGVYTIVRENRHHDWTVRDSKFGCTHDVYRGDVEFVTA